MNQVLECCDLHAKLLEAERACELVTPVSQVTSLLNAFAALNMTNDERVEFSNRHIFGKPKFWQSFHHAGNDSSGEEQYDAFAAFVRMCREMPTVTESRNSCKSCFHRVAEKCHLSL